VCGAAAALQDAWIPTKHSCGYATLVFTCLYCQGFVCGYAVLVLKCLFCQGCVCGYAVLVFTCLYCQGCVEWTLLRMSATSI